MSEVQQQPGTAPTPPPAAASTPKTTNPKVEAPKPQLATSRASDLDPVTRQRPHKTKTPKTGTMPVLAHLTEIRRRLIWSFVGIGLAAIGGWFLYDLALGHITAPMKSVTGAELNYQTIGAAFDMKLKVSLWLGVVLASPWWIFQIIAFLWPGLKRRERVFLVIFGIFAVVLFGAGVVFGDWVIPRAVEILGSFQPPDSVMLLQADMYLKFYIRLVLAFGVSFLVPELLVMLNFLGVLRARQMLRAWRAATMVSFIFSAIANPLPTPWPVIAQALVLLGLYFIAVGIAALHDHRVAKRSR